MSELTRWQAAVKNANPTAYAELTWQPGASEETLRRLEETLAYPLPPELSAFLIVHDGAYDKYGDALVLSAQHIIEVTETMREAYGDPETEDVWGHVEPEKYLAFSSWLGNGDLYCYHREQGIVRFEHEEGEAEALAPSLEALCAKAVEGVQA